MKYVNLIINNIFDKIQLNILYIYIIYNLIISFLNTILNTESTFTYLNKIEKYLPKYILNTMISSSRTGANNYTLIYFFSYLILETLIIRPKFNLSMLVKYNILLIISLIFLKNLLLNYSQILFSLPLPINKTTSFLRGKSLESVIPLSLFNIITTIQIHFLFFVLYIMAYINALKGKFFRLPYLDWMFDSIAFWLRLKTPTMNI